MKTEKEAIKKIKDYLTKNQDAAILIYSEIFAGEYPDPTSAIIGYIQSSQVSVLRKIYSSIFGKDDLYYSL